MSEKFKSGLVSAGWLARHLGDPKLRLFDCTAFLGFDPDVGIIVRTGRPEYEEAHIPGAAFLDLYNDLSVQVGEVMFMNPDPKAFSQSLSAAGLGDGHQVVLYSSSETIYWATRLWWMLRANGFTNAAVLDGGLPQWKIEGKPTTNGQEYYPEATFTAKPDAARWVDKETVFSEIGSTSVCTINALSHEEYLGTAEWTAFDQQAYSRKGRIPGSLNVPYSSLLTKDGLFAPVDHLKQIFEDMGALDHDRIILYCGAGLASTMDALALHLIGYDNVAIYDGSIHEWGWDHSLPIETG